MDIARIADVAAGECERQQTDFNGYVRLLQAYQFGYQYRDDPITPNYIYSLATLIEPNKNQFSQYRRTPVTFADTSHGVHWDLIPNAMSQWFDMVNDPSDNMIMRGPARMREQEIYEFLRIHPFRDGNGRLAWIVRTRLYDQWESPEPLPKYFPGRVNDHN